MSISVLFSNLVGLFLLIGVGFCAVRAKLVPGEATGAMTSMLMKITLPATVFSSMIRPFDQSFLWDALLMVGLAIGLHLGYIVLCRLALPVFRVPQGRRGMWMVCSIFCNNGFMGFPVAYALFGDEGLALAVMLGMPITAMPSAAVSVALGEEYDGCVELGARAVFVTSLFCVVTIPLVALLLNNVQ